MDHISIVVRSLEASGKFYDAVLGTLGWKRIMNFPYMIAYGPAAPVFFIVQKPEADVKASQLGGVHFAFSAPNPDAVKTCYETAIANGATDNGPAGPRPAYGPSFYGGFFIDLDGWRMEVCCHNYSA